MLIARAARARDRRGHMLLHATETLPIRNRGQASGHEAGLLELFLSKAAAFEPSAALSEILSAGRRDSVANARIVGKAVNVREAVLSAEQGIPAPKISIPNAPAKTAVAETTVEIVPISEVYERNVSDSKTPPRRKEVARAAGQPSDIAKPKAESNSVTPAEE